MRTIVSLFDESGNALRPWAELGYECYAFDMLNDGKSEFFDSGGFISYLPADATGPTFQQRIIDLAPVFIMSFSPCTDLAVSGSRHFESKRARNPNFQEEATDLARMVEIIANKLQIPFFHENPVSVLTSTWRAANYTFDPYEYGGYLPVDDIHPRFPEYIAARDAYPKRTCLRTGNNFIMPKKLPVTPKPGWSTQTLLLGGKSAKTKMIRSETPRGFALAVCLANHGKLGRKDV